jgi:hypothetical protein
MEAVKTYALLRRTPVQALMAFVGKMIDGDQGKQAG